MSIRIDNLTEEQVEMLDIMWSFEMIDELEEWQSTLSSRERRMSEQLMRLVLAFLYPPLQVLQDLEPPLLLRQ